MLKPINVLLCATAKLLFFASFLSLSFFSNAQNTIPTVGTDFWMGYMNNSGSSNAELRLFVTGQTACTGTVELPLVGWTANFTVIPNATTTIIIPNIVAEHTSNDVVDNKGVHITTTDTVSVFAINFATFSADASKILPKVALGTNYLVSAYNGLGASNKSEFLIVATEDGTQIQITPSVSTAGGHNAGVPYIIDLDQGETYQVYSQVAAADLTGTLIEATPLSGDCRPFAVYGGAQCSNVPTNCSTCDHMYDQLFPIETWGTEYYIAPFQSTGSYTYRILARDNGTQVSINGGAPFNMTSGQVLEYNNISTAQQVVSNSPIQVIQHMQGDACSLSGDPAMLILNANDQKINEVTFSTVSSLIITTHFLNVVVETADIGTVLLDNIPIPVGSFSQFPSNPINAYAQVAVTQGSHNIYAANGFTAYSYGMGNAESYAYSVGSYKAEQVLQIDSLICTTDTVVLSPPYPIFNPEWSTLSDPTTIIGTSNILNLYPPIITDVYEINGLSFVSGCPLSFNFSVAVPTIPVINATVSEDTVCLFQSVQVDVQISSPGVFEYNWFPAYQFNDPTLQSPTLLVQESGWYGVTVSTIGGICTLASDSVYVYVSGGGVQSVDVTASNYQLCAPDSTQLLSEVQQVVFNEDFDGGTNPNLWTSITGGTPSAVCGSNSGQGLYFSGALNRFAETVDLDVSQGGNVDFYLKVANGIAPCDDADFGEDILFEYSTNAGLTWVTVATLFEFSYPTFTYVTLSIPAGAQTASTRFRWIQPNFSAPNQDVWIIDNALISVINSANLNFNWSPALTLNDPTSPNPIASPENPTWYILEIGQGNCIYSDSVFIDANPEFTLATTNDTTLCSDQQLELVTTPSAGSGYVFSWTPNPSITSNVLNDSISIWPSATSTFYVSVVSPSGCTLTDSVFVDLTELNVEIDGDSLLCSGESSLLNGILTNTTIANYTFEWFDPLNQSISTSSSVQVTPGSTSIYSVQISDPNSLCQWTDSITVVVDDFTVDAGEDTVLCAALGYQLNGFTDAQNAIISWDNAPLLSNSSILNPALTQAASNDFILSVDNGNCIYSDTVSIVFSPPLNVYIPDDTTICLGELFVLDFQTATNISWSTLNGISNANPLLPGFSPTQNIDYIVTYSTSNNCPFVDSMSVEVLEIPTVSLPVDVSICSNVPLFVEATSNVNGADYLWNTSETDSSIWIQNQGLYWVSVTTQCGTDSDSINIDFFPQFSIDLGNDTTICETYNLTLAPIIPSGASVLWSNQSVSSTLTVSSPSTTSIIVEDANGCIELDTIVINAFPGIQLALSPDVSMCDYETTTLDGTSPQGISYLWNTGEITPTITVDSAGIFIVEIGDIGGCFKWDTIVVVETPTPQPQIVGPVDFCENEVVQFSVAQSYSQYLWYSGATTSTVDQLGLINEIYVQVTDQFGCVGNDTLPVNVVDVPVLDLGEDIVLCETGVTVLDGIIPGGTSYLWNNGESSSSIDALPGHYILEVGYGICFVSDSITISVVPMEFQLDDDLVICRDEDIFVAHPLTGIDSIVWQDGSNSSWYEQNYIYSLEDSVLVIGTAYGCRVEVDSMLFVIEDCNCKVYVPNSITMDNDGINEVFKVYHDCPVEEFWMRIFNRWGDLIFETYDINFQWDGRKLNGEFAQDGVYTWSMRYVNEYTFATTFDELQGHITILR
ncbi:MAG: gliding motility-associated-like protein [Crocinitomicaceae bacterium]|jgi:gliding motility-associated-like protein